MRTAAEKRTRRLSGVDALRHAFAGEVGFVVSRGWKARVPLGRGVDCGAEWFGPHEVHEALCGAVPPSAVVLALADGSSRQQGVTWVGASAPTGVRPAGGG